MVESILPRDAVALAETAVIPKDLRHRHLFDKKGCYAIFAN